MNYTFSKTIDDCVYSIDMLYIRGYLTCSSVSANAYCLENCSQHKSFKGRCKYSWFQEMYVFDGVTIYVGLFDNFNVISRTWSVVPMAEVRFNPNKYPNNSFVDWFLSVTDSRYLTKFDFACDVPCEPKYILVESNRSISYLNNGETRYYGAFGSDGRVKVYNKQKEQSDSGIDCSEPLTRIEVTLRSNNIDSFINERFYRLSSLSLDFDKINGLNDTDITILTLFTRLKAYEPNIAIEDFKLGRVKEKKIKDALLSSSPSYAITFSLELLLEVLDVVSVRYECSIKAINKQLLTETCDSDDELPLPNAFK